MKSALLFIHGARGSRRVWEYQLEFFDNAIAVDLAGHDGGVGKNTIDEYVEEVKRFCDEKSLRNIVTVGHSIGGAVAQKFTIDRCVWRGGVFLDSFSGCSRVQLHALSRGYVLKKEA